MGFVINKEQFLKIELIGILACFCGVVMMAMSSFDEDAAPKHDETVPHGIFVHYGRIIGILTMCFVAFNDGMLAVLARTMKDIHFSVLMFWFSAIGVFVLNIYLGCNAFMRKELPSIFRYNAEQYFYLGMTGLFSALNLTCLTIAY